MLGDEVDIELSARLWMMNRVLDCIVPDPPTEVVNEVTIIVLRAVGRQEVTQAVTVLEEEMDTNPYWLRGYLLLATIYQYALTADQAIATTEKGLAVCTDGLRLFSVPTGVESSEQFKGPVVHSRIRYRAERLKRLRRYERMFRYRLAMLQIRCGNLDEAIEQWSAIEKVPCA